MKNDVIVELGIFLCADFAPKVLQHVCVVLKLESDCFAKCLLNGASFSPVILRNVWFPQMRDAVIVLGASFLARFFVFRLSQGNTHIADFFIRRTEQTSSLCESSSIDPLRFVCSFEMDGVIVLLRASFRVQIFLLRLSRMCSAL